MKTTTSVPSTGLVQMVARMIATASLIVLGFVNGACRRMPSIDGQPRVGVLRAASARFAVLLKGSMYEGEIGYHFTNNSGATLSMNYCNLVAPLRYRCGIDANDVGRSYL
jgi:hypothetical protein